MTPKDKAKELVDKYINLYPSYIVMFQGDLDKVQSDIKQCALIAVDEILNVKSFLKSMPLQDLKYWQEVKQEIEKL